MALTGNETLQVLGQDATGAPAATTQLTTTGAIAALAATEYSGQVVTAISTAGNGTLTAAAMAGGVISRTGPSGAFTDTTATAAQIFSQTGSNTSVTFFTEIKNTTAFAETLVGGTGVTIAGNTIIPANSTGTYLLTFTNGTTATFTHVSTAPLTTSSPKAITALSTVAAGTITAAGIAGGITSRTGSQSGTPFTDTTDTAANIIAAIPNARIGSAYEYVYQNTTNATATVTGGSGVTVSGITSIPAGNSVRYLLTYTAANTMTMVGFSAGQATSASQQVVVLAGSTSGTTTVKASATAGSTTQTYPAVTGVVASTSGTNLFIADTKIVTAQVDATTTTLANVTGLSFTVVPGTYTFEAYLPTTCGGTGGVKLAFNYTTAVLSAISAKAYAYTASAIAESGTITTTTQTSIVTSATAFTSVILKGTIVVTTGGTVDLQFAENNANGTSSVLVNGNMTFVRIV